MTNFQIVYDATAKKVVVQLAGDPVPGGYTNIGTFSDVAADTLGDDSRVAYSHVRDALFGQGVTDMTQVTIHLAPQSVTVAPATAALGVSETKQLSVEFAPENVYGVDGVAWSTSNAGVATVDANGLVTAVAAGSATITATTDIGSKTDTCDVTVT